MVANLEWDGRQHFGAILATESFVKCDTGAAALTLTLPTGASAVNQELIVMITAGANTVTIQRSGTDTLYGGTGGTSYTLTTTLKYVRLLAVGGGLGHCWEQLTWLISLRKKAVSSVVTWRRSSQFLSISDDLQALATEWTANAYPTGAEPAGNNITDEDLSTVAPWLTAQQLNQTVGAVDAVNVTVEAQRGYLEAARP